MNTLIIGLGLIGGSAARRMHGFRNSRVIGVDLDEETLRRAHADGAIDEGTADAGAVVQDADFILVMDGGRIVEQGNHDELVALNGIYREIFDSQTKSKEA